VTADTAASFDAVAIGTDIQRRIGVKTSRDEPLARFTTMRVGGPADLFATAHNAFELRARAHPFDFLMYSIPQLTQAGFEIYGEEDLKAGRINRATPTLRVHITSGIDWFDLKTVVEFGTQQISLHDLRKAVKRGERYVKLADGSVGQIPEEWLNKYKHLWNLAEETEAGYVLACQSHPVTEKVELDFDR